LKCFRCVVNPVDMGTHEPSLKTKKTVKVKILVELWLLKSGFWPLTARLSRIERWQTQCESILNPSLLEKSFAMGLVCYVLHLNNSLLWCLLVRGLSWSYGSSIYNYLSSPTLWVQTSLRRPVLDTILCEQLVVFSRYSCFPTNKTDRHDITEILLKVALSTIKPTKLLVWYWYSCIYILNRYMY
jgi:hypothetical protein